MALRLNIGFLSAAILFQIEIRIIGVHGFVEKKYRIVLRVLGCEFPINDLYRSSIGRFQPAVMGSYLSFTPTFLPLAGTY